MDMQLVMVRDYQGKALRRVALEVLNGRVFVCTERTIRLAETGELPALGFPVADVFAFDEVAYQNLTDQWECGTTDSMDWASLKPFV